MKRTVKYLAACKAARGLKIAIPDDQPALYAALAAKSFAWFADRAVWEKSARPIRDDGTESVSIFTDASGKPSGIYRLRVMASEDEIGPIVAELKRALCVIDESSEAYQNRRGPGWRVYLTIKRGEK